ncbi:MAG: extracellular solute-binding protein, partial [Spirochaetales bacterium]
MGELFHRRSSMKKAIFTALVILFISGMAVATGGTEPAGADGPRELVIWEELWYNTSVSFPTLAETPLYQEVMKRTGIDVSWIHPPQGQTAEQFNLMIASNDLPDMIFYDWVNSYPGGPEKAISDGVILKLNDLLKSDAPNLMKLYADNPPWFKSAKTDNGTLFSFPFIRGGADLMVFFGPQLRGDWLNQLGMDLRVTLDDWEAVLTAMKEAGLTDSPMTFTKFTAGRGINGPGNAFIQPFGTTWDFHQVDGKVTFGPYEDEYLAFLTFFKGWFDKGLVDPEFFSNERNSFDAKILNGNVGAWTSYTGSGIGAYLDDTAGKGTFDIVPTLYPVVDEGDIPFFGQRDNPLPGVGMAITTQAADPA